MNWIIKLLGFTINVNWEGQRITHYAWTRKGAYEWMNCYPIEARVWITHSFDRVFHASRQLIRMGGM